MPKHPLSKHLIDQIIFHSDGSLSPRMIADIVGVHDETVRKYQILNDCKRQRRSGVKRGPAHVNWNSGRKLDRDGYVLISCGPEHPYIRKQKDRQVGLILEHRIMMEIKIGRILLPNEVVDHIDGCKIHNDFDNLRLFSSNNEHLKKTISGQVPQWSDQGKAKFQLARWNKPIHMFPEQIDTHRLKKKSGVLRLQEILHAHELLDNQSIWFLGMKRYFEQMQIAWPFDHKKEDDLLKKYLQILLCHPMLKLWIEG
jgi:hypothetical protein